MAEIVNIQDILADVKKLDKEQQFTLLEKLVSLIKNIRLKDAPVKLSEISGVGAKIWNEINIDEYIDKERQW